MFATTTVRKHLLDLLNSVSGARHETLYEYLVNPESLVEYIKRARGRLAVDPHDKCSRKVAKALDELEVVAENLRRELSSPSPIFTEFMTEVIKASFEGTEELLDMLQKRMVELSKFIVFDGLKSAKTGRAVAFYNIGIADVFRILENFSKRKDVPMDIHEVFQSIAMERMTNKDFIRFAYALASRVAKVDADSRTVYVGKHAVRLERDTDLLAVLTALNRVEDVNKVITNMLKQSDLLSRLPITVKSIEMISPVRNHAAVTLSLLNDGKHEVVVEVDLVYGGPTEARLFFASGPYRVEFTSVGSLTDALPSMVERLIGDMSSIEKYFKKFVAVADAIERLGYSLVHGTSVMERVVARKGMFEIDCDFYWNLDTVMVDYRVSLPEHVARVLDAGKVAELVSRGGYPVRVELSDGWLLIRLQRGFKLDELPSVDAVVSDAVSKAVDDAVQFYKDIPDEDAVALYIAYRYSQSPDSFAKSVKPSIRVVSEKAVKALAKHVVPADRVGVLLGSPAEMLKHGVLAVDDEGYVTIMGRRVEDVCKRYGAELEYCKAAEAKLLYITLKVVEVGDVFKEKRVPSRVVDLLLNPPPGMEVSSEVVEYVFKKIASDEEVWSKLTRSDKYKIFKALGDDFLDIVASEGWDWVFGDRRVNLMYEASKMEPSNLTAYAGKYFKDELGGDYELVTVDGKHFLKSGDVYLQLVKVMEDRFRFRGTIGDSKVEVEVEAKDVNEACKLVRERLVNAYNEFNNVVSRTPEIRTREEVEIPLHPSFDEMVKKFSRSGRESEETPTQAS